MPDLTRFIDDTIDHIQAPIAAYYAEMEGVNPTSIRGRVAAALAIRRASASFKSALKEAMTVAGVLATGGNLSGEQRAQILYALQDQIGYADGFMAALPGLTRDQALARASSYLPSILHVYSDLQVYDIPELPVMPGDGQTICQAWCRCTLRIAKSGNDYDVSWQLGIAEHCEDCVQLSELWNPLRIRNGVIIDDFDYSFLGASERKMLMKTLLAIASGKQVA
jgi:hypothetical protein